MDMGDPMSKSGTVIPTSRSVTLCGKTISKKVLLLLPLLLLLSVGPESAPVISMGCKASDDRQLHTRELTSACRG